MTPQAHALCSALVVMSALLSDAAHAQTEPPQERQRPDVAAITEAWTPA